MAKDLEKILDHDHRSSIKWWTDNLVLVKEALRTGKLIDGTNMTEEDRAEFEGFETFILDNLRRIRSTIEGLDEMGDIFVKAILGWMSVLPEDLDDRIPKEFIREISTKAGEAVKIKVMEEQEREKWR